MSNSSGGFFDVPAKRDELGKIEKEASAPDFWSDQEAAQKLLQKRSGLDRVITRQGKFETEISDAGVRCTDPNGRVDVMVWSDLRRIEIMTTDEGPFSPDVFWVLIGIAWYAICFIGLVRLLPYWPEQKMPVVLLMALMLANGAANIPAFRMRRLDLAFAFFLLYWPLLAAFLWVACPLDRLTCALFGLYAVYQIYAAAWAWQLWRINRPAS